jgi:hypothetical protein
MPIRPPAIRPKPVIRPRAPGAPKPTVPKKPVAPKPVAPKPTPKKPPVTPPKTQTSGTSWLTTFGMTGAVVGAGFLPSLVGGATSVANTAILADKVTEFGEYLVDNPWALVAVGGVVYLILR